MKQTIVCILLLLTFKIKADDVIFRQLVTNDMESFKSEVLTRDSVSNLYNRRGESIMHFAIKNKSSEAVLFMLENDIDFPVYKNKGQYSVLSYAAKYTNDKSPILSALLSKDEIKNSINIKDISGNTPISYATKLKKISIFKTLLSSDASIKTINSKGQNLLMLSMYKDTNPIFKYLIKHYPEMLNETDKRQNTIYHYASRTESSIFLEELKQLNNKKYIEMMFKKNKKGNIPLFNAIDNNNIEAVVYILKTTSSIINISNNYGYNAVSYAANPQTTKIFEYLLNKTYSRLSKQSLFDIKTQINYFSDIKLRSILNTTIHNIQTKKNEDNIILTEKEKFELISRYIESNEYNNIKSLVEKSSLYSYMRLSNDDGTTLLMKAARLGSLQIIRLLVKKSIVIDTDIFGLDAIDYAKAANRKPIQIYLENSIINNKDKESSKEKHTLSLGKQNNGTVTNKRLKDIGENMKKNSDKLSGLIDESNDDLFGWDSDLDDDIDLQDEKLSSDTL